MAKINYPAPPNRGTRKQKTNAAVTVIIAIALSLLAIGFALTIINHIPGK